MDYFHGLAFELMSDRCDKLQAINYLNLAHFDVRAPRR